MQILREKAQRLLMQGASDWWQVTRFLGSCPLCCACSAVPTAKLSRDRNVFVLGHMSIYTSAAWSNICSRTTAKVIMHST